MSGRIMCHLHALSISTALWFCLTGHKNWLEVHMSACLKEIPGAYQFRPELMWCLCDGYGYLHAVTLH
jgi:hypothetical protein